MNSVSKDPRKKKGIGFGAAWNGIREVYQTEKNFKIHLGAAGITGISGILFQLSAMEWTVVVAMISLVLCLEIVNSSIERVLDYTAPELHPLVGMAKDIAAGAVLMAATGSVIVALFIFIPKIRDLF